MGFRDDREALEAKVRAQRVEIERLQAELEAERARAAAESAAADGKSEIERAGDAFERAFSSSEPDSKNATRGAFRAPAGVSRSRGDSSIMQLATAVVIVGGGLWFVLFGIESRYALVAVLIAVVVGLGVWIYRVAAGMEDEDGD